MSIKKITRDWCPPVLLGWIRLMRGANGLSFSGDFSSWGEAERNSSGYDAAEVLQRVSAAALKVKHGEAVFERDSVCFHHAEFRWPVLACLLSVAAARGGHLNVLDFGGSLGSFYFQHRQFFLNLKQVEWFVVEQKQFVQFGQAHIQDDVLHFYESVKSCIQEGSSDVVLLSSVLQYLEDPTGTLTSLAETRASYILVDRTPFITGFQNRLTVQKVPKEIYDASYPAWFFSEENFIATMKSLNYHLVLEFSCDEHADIGEYKGMFFERA